MYIRTNNYCSLLKNIFVLVILIFSGLPIHLFAQNEADNQGKLKFSGFIQAQYQYGQKDATLRVGDKNTDPDKSFNRIGIRRGRVKLTYTDGIASGVGQVDITENGLRVRDIYMELTDPWTKSNQLVAGLFSVPFGYEIEFSTSVMESPERANVYEALFGTSRDLGGLLKLRPFYNTALKAILFEAGIFSGNGINKDIDNRKDLLIRLSTDDQTTNGTTWGIGSTYYYGHVFNPTSISYEMDEDKFIQKATAKAGSFMKREYFGIDGRISIPTSIGTTTIRAEGVLGIQPGVVNSNGTPSYGSTPPDNPAYSLYKRPFIGYYAVLSQRIGQSPFTAFLKYDVYDPNRDTDSDSLGRDGSFTGEADRKYANFGIGGIYQFTNRIRLQAYYEFVNPEDAPWMEINELKANRFTVRLQYRW